MGVAVACLRFVDYRFVDSRFINYFVYFSYLVASHKQFGEVLGAEPPVLAFR